MRTSPSRSLLSHVLLSLSLLSLSACGAASSPVRTANDRPGEEGVVGAARPLPGDGPQGIAGVVTVLAGDHMPPFEGGGAAPSAHAPVHVLRGAHAPMAILDRASPDYVGSTTTAADGTYRAALPPGIYTVLVEHDGAPYLNTFTGDGRWSTVTVTAGAWASFDIRDSADAVF